ncbi:trypsin-like peptidase domain-containing protein [Kitasatospora nipponensis]|uniref:Trypsin-like peptidase domain-containing protein n=1 Tax=Kitasatospora nipponensis TaxID=258049 RepID=A0ABP4G9I1_9ACTN
MAGRGLRRGVVKPAIATALSVLAVLATGCQSQPTGPRGGPLLTATLASEGPLAARVGVLLLPDQGDARSCTASVVHSPGGDLLATAAHCVYRTGIGPVADLAFEPGFRDGNAPGGGWVVDRITVDQRWREDGDPEYDVAFVTVRDTGGRHLEDVVGGGNALGVNRGFGLPVTVTGYPFDHDEPITCSTRTTAQSSTQQRFDCGGFSDGTSGSPWLTGIDPATGLGTLVGVIGGYQAGGDTPDTSYSVSFDDRVAALYAQATA